MIPPNPCNRLHYQHPLCVGRATPDTHTSRGGQFPTPITPPKGSIFHADSQPIDAALPGYTTAYDISPHAGEAGFDDSAWPAIEAEDLAARRSGGYVAFIWYRVNLTIPERIGDFETAGRTAVLTALVDDYGEVWVDGQMPRRAGYPSPATIQGFNMPNRVVLSDDVQLGDQFQIAIFGINGPISVAPANTVWFREARLEFYP